MIIKTKASRIVGAKQTEGEVRERGLKKVRTEQFNKEDTNIQHSSQYSKETKSYTWALSYS